MVYAELLNLHLNLNRFKRAESPYDLQDISINVRSISSCVPVNFVKPQCSGAYMMDDCTPGDGCHHDLDIFIRCEREFHILLVSANTI